MATDHYNAAADIVCPEGKAGMELLIYSDHTDKTAAKAMCTLTAPPQTELETVTLTNSGSGVLVDGSALTGLDVKVKSTSCACPGEAAEAETTSGALDVDGGLTLTATNMGEAVELGIGTE